MDAKTQKAELTAPPSWAQRSIWQPPRAGVHHACRPWLTASACVQSGVFSRAGSREALQKAVIDGVRPPLHRRRVCAGHAASKGLPRLNEIVRRWIIARATWKPHRLPVPAGAFELDDREGELRDVLLGEITRWRGLRPLYRAAGRGGRAPGPRHRRRPAGWRTQRPDHGPAARHRFLRDPARRTAGVGTAWSRAACPEPRRTMSGRPWRPCFLIIPMWFERLAHRPKKGVHDPRTDLLKPPSGRSTRPARRAPCSAWRWAPPTAVAALPCAPLFRLFARRCRPVAGPWGAARGTRFAPDILAVRGRQRHGLPGRCCHRPRASGAAGGNGRGEQFARARVIDAMTRLQREGHHIGVVVGRPANAAAMPPVLVEMLVLIAPPASPALDYTCSVGEGLPTTSRPREGHPGLPTGD